MLTPGAVIDGRYEIVGPLGAGGMGQVFRARRIRLGDDVALKALHPADIGPESTERFLRESRACAQLRHPHIVSILDYDVDAAGQPFLVMELLSGPSLREELDLGGAFTPARALAVIDAVAAAMQLAHDHDITHRDLKPANIVAHIYGSGERVYKVIDFGLASLKLAPEATRLTLPFTFLGTMAYAAPEQLAGEAVGPATDQYALGVIAYEMLAGKRPFQAAEPLALAQEVLSGTTTPPSAVGPAVVHAADAAILRAMARRPEDRWPSVSDFAAAITAALAPAEAAERQAPPIDGSGLLARYEVGEVLGPGRLGSVVRRGTHRALGVPVAIRYLKRESQPHWNVLRDRFLLEARTLQVRHRHLLQVRDFGEDATGVFVVTDLVVGPSLRDVVAAGAVPWPTARRLILQMSDAAETLHAHGGLLTGVNPDMIRVTGAAGAEQLVLTTGGIRALADVLATMREQQLRGEESSELELPYMAPEVLTGRPPDVRADLFSVAAVATYMITGRPPFRAASLPELIGQMLQPAPPGPPPPGVPADAIRTSPARSPPIRPPVARSGSCARPCAPPRPLLADVRRGHRLGVRQPAIARRGAGRAGRSPSRTRSSRPTSAPRLRDPTCASIPSTAWRTGRSSWSSSVRPAAVMRVVTTRRSACSRPRAMSDRLSSRSRSRVTSGSRVTSRRPISVHGWPSAPAPRRIRKTLYWASESWCGLRTAATSRDSRSVVRTRLR